ncbi:uncharacterized protein LOC5513563 isoform X2 [Nematostella vectensis]|uniref:uncharacterized protein LOC5513563 isoform X2 n=1 Tax=Nematostella vectensis TaxID=45351 RepID=UPI00138FDED8|nr:uncharacterized protein LOC5513563 isoform X2 [Nematostella vectensis]
MDLPIASAANQAQREEQYAVVEHRKFQNIPDFMPTVIAIRENLFSVQGHRGDLSCDKEVLNAWKRKNKTAFQLITDFRRYEKVAKLSTRNFNLVIKISAAPHEYTTNGKISQYTFQFIKASMSEDDIFTALSDILDKKTRIADLNKKETTPGDKKEGCKSCEAYNELIERNKRDKKDVDEINESLRREIKALKSELSKAKTERDSFKAKCEKLQMTVNATQHFVDELQKREVVNLRQHKENERLLESKLNECKAKLEEYSDKYHIEYKQPQIQENTDSAGNQDSPKRLVKKQPHELSTFSGENEYSIDETIHKVSLASGFSFELCESDEPFLFSSEREGEPVDSTIPPSPEANSVADYVIPLSPITLQDNSPNDVTEVRHSTPKRKNEKKMKESKRQKKGEVHGRSAPETQEIVAVVYSTTTTNEDIFFLGSIVESLPEGKILIKFMERN